ncbi:MAG: AarF/ABC1/UbiB kinase family protein [Gammaproteobacteria bacterium]|nr:AarF/ABC1/UbiB kinase family protein [Gammaproteobacteria bacterium]
MMGRLAGGMVGGMLGEGARQLARGQRASLADLVLTPANMDRLAERLSEMRGAAMKVGQLLSMDSGDMLPPALGELLARLREDAHTMPLGEVADVLRNAWGEGWQSRFHQFSFTPIAAASIGQVHSAHLDDGRRVAVKVQYPGVRASIDSDVDNVSALLRIARVLPERFDIGPLLDEAKRQLHLEADYQYEADSLTRFAALLDDDPRFLLPNPVPELCTGEVLCMQFLSGDPIESLRQAAAGRRDAAAGALTGLALREVFEWGLVQTDPNFANYLYDVDTGQIQLLDFGATRVYPEHRRNALLALLMAAVDGDDSDLLDAATAVGYLTENDSGRYRQVVIQLLRMAAEPARQDNYSFGTTDLAQRMRNVVIDMRLREPMGQLPPVDVLYLHRKLGGLYLLLARLRARVPVKQLVRELPFLPDRPRSGQSATLAAV